MGGNNGMSTQQYSNGSVNPYEMET